MHTAFSVTFSFLLLASSLVRAQLVEPYYHIVGNIAVDGHAVTQEVLTHWNPYTLELDVPADQAAVLQGFDIGFAVLPSKPDYSIELDSVRFTHFSYSVNHLDVATGVETPVRLPDGTAMTDVPIPVFGSESSNDPGPTAFTAPLGRFSVFGGSPNSPTGSSIVGSSVNGVGVIFVTGLKLNWDFVPDFTRPKFGKGYVVHFDIRIVPTYLGVEYPEKKIATTYPEFHHHDDVAFVYQVVDVPLPEFVSITPFAWENMPGGTDHGLVLEMSGTHLEYFKLQRSSDLKTWTDWDFGGEGGDWSWPYTVPADDVGWGFWPSTYHWTLFDMNFPNERRMPQREFYRMVWTGKRAVWRTWSPTEDRPW